MNFNLTIEEARKKSIQKALISLIGLIPVFIWFLFSKQSVMLYLESYIVFEIYKLFSIIGIVFFTTFILLSILSYPNNGHNYLDVE
jgi:hypothetical protein